MATRKPAKRIKRRRSPSSRGLLRGVDASRLSPRGRALLEAAMTADAPITSLAVPNLGQAARRLPTSPWVRRATEGKLPTKDMTNSSAPRPDVYRGFGDVIRMEPNILRQATAGIIDHLGRAVGEMNGQRVAAGQRAIDYPGRRANVTKRARKPAAAAKKATPKAATTSRARPAARAVERANSRASFKRTESVGGYKRASAPKSKSPKSKASGARRRVI